MLHGGTPLGFEMARRSAAIQSADRHKGCQAILIRLHKGKGKAVTTIMYTGKGGRRGAHRRRACAAARRGAAGVRGRWSAGAR